jgi:soluble lytic murein transglycosylase-like protein
MGKINIKIPALATAFYTSTQVSQVRDRLGIIKAKYGAILANVSKTSNIPVDLIASFIFIESEGKETAVSSAGAIGLMQLNIQTASDVIFMEKSKGRLNTEETAILRHYLGTRLDCIFKMKWMGHKLPCNSNTGVSVKKEDLLNPEFNIVVGCLYLGLLIDKYTESGTIRLDKVVWAYNRGYFSKMPSGNINALLSAAPTETKNYVLKLIGKNSTMDILTA